MKFILAGASLTMSMALMLECGPAWAFDSGSTGALGALVPSSNIEIPLPPDGVLHYTEVSIPSTVTVTFTANDLNTPVYLLASGNVTVNGTINVSGKQATVINKKHITYLGGQGGPGGSAGGSGREGIGVNAWQDGVGPGAGRGTSGAWQNQASGGASHLYPGQKTTSGPAAPAAHANLQTWPLHGGSGGGVGYGTQGDVTYIYSTGNTGPKTAGGGGGGAITIAANGTLTVQGSILANGGTGWGGSGAGGGGNIRLIASEIIGNGTLSARGNLGCGTAGWTGACGGNGFILLEAYDITGSMTVTANPEPYFGEPTVALPYTVGQEPTLRVSSVGGQPAPLPAAGAHPLANPTLTLQQGSSVTVDIEATYVPVGTVVKVAVNRLGATRVVVDAPPLDGSLLLSTTSVAVNVPAGTRVGAIEAWIPSLPAE